jgi:hypothetical protein
VNCWDTFTFNNSTCTWDNDGTAKPAANKRTVGILYFQQSLLVLGIMMEQQTCSTRKVNCWDTLLSTIQPVLGIMMVQLNL